jgi:predicted AlkP superfamily pyrophosphatase or phosphodiesterase
MRNPKRIALFWAFSLGTAAMGLPAAAADQPQPDGLRALMVSEETAPTMAAIRDKGINFKNPHSLFPTFTTPNASAMATGHYLFG